ncbi:MAG: hypothetical protein GQ565_02720 [Candidatus Aegiribacteria sp.]|nr:hypothetical protein [Candidatus Aegiribacteria sp.]
MQSGGDKYKASGETVLSTRGLAESHTISENRKNTFNLPSRLRKYSVLLQSAYKYFRSQEGEHSHAAEWVLDNYYIIQQAIRQVREDMPGDYYRQLPVLTSPVHLEPSRVFSIAWSILQCSENQLDMVLITRFVRNYQKITPLTMGELWAIPTMLRFGILEKLFRLISSIAGLPCEEICDIGKAEEAADEDDTVAACIQSLRMFAVQDWKDYFEKTSLVEGILRHDPSGDYTGMDFATRNSYRLTVEEIGSESDRDELRVAREAIGMADEAGDDPRSGHVGFFLHTREGRKLLEDRLGCSRPASMNFRRMLWEHASEVYAGSIAMIFLIFLLCVLGYALAEGASVLQMLSVLLLCLLPASAAGVNLVNSFLMHNTIPKRLPRMDFSRGIPPEYRTMVVIPTLLSDPGDIHSMIRQLERHYLANRDRNLTFAVLSDFADAPERQIPGDGELLELAYNEIEKLNRRYHHDSGDPFYQFHRRRKWNPGEGCWMGWERKRGKLMEFNRLLRGKGGTSYDVRIGELRILPDIRYVITLDADTSLPQNCARRLVSTMAHPLNRVLLDRKTCTFMNGYTVLQPRILTAPLKGSESLFSRTFAGDFSVDLYSNAVSDVYQDLFGEGNYVGKGIYDVEAFDRHLEGRIPENSLLSHDLFEGIHGRAGLVTDIVLYEDYPPHYLAWTNRLHRWIRGDWQLLPWLRSTVPDATGNRRRNDLSFLDRWKIIDNMRRSLLTPALLVLLMAGWLWLPGSPLFWTSAVLLIEFSCPLADTIFEFFRKLRRKSYLKVTGPMKAGWLRSLFALVFLLYETCITIDATVTTIIRLAVTRKRLLQWRSAAHTVRMFGRELKMGLVWARMYTVIIFVPVICAILLLLHPDGLPFAAPFLIAWLVSPRIAHLISRTPTVKRIPPEDERYASLRMLAVRTWHFFETYVGPEDHWLPPDHFQEEPLSKVAHRTSPTNIGLFLLSVLAAHDRGYIGTLEFTLRLSDTLNAMKQLERYRGHLLNWYDTRTLEPLHPRYVSVVDSGNLAGCLLVLKQGCLEMRGAAILSRRRWEGFIDILDILSGILRKECSDQTDLLEIVAGIRRMVMEALDNPRARVTMLMNLYNTQLVRMERMLIEIVRRNAGTVDIARLKELRIWSGKMRRHLGNMLKEINTIFPWMIHICNPPELFRNADTARAIADAWRFLKDSLPPSPSPETIREITPRVRFRIKSLITLLKDEPLSSESARDAIKWCRKLEDLIDESLKESGNIIEKINDLAAAAEKEFRRINFSFLFSRRRKVFHIGYNLESGHLDPNYYDLLASEARLASLVAIGKGDVPRSHWLHLARPLTVTGGMKALISWSGTMFEYLMPILIVGSYENSILEQSCRAAVKRQIAYSRSRDVPWGISESSYYSFDAGMHYQYRAFGVPGFGFKRGLEEDLVISPYASLLALPIDPNAVLDNIKDLVASGLLGMYGFYESIDFTTERLAMGKENAVILSYMAHHQGMILLSIVNFLNNNSMVRRFQSEPLIQIVNLLLYEQIPEEAPFERVRPDIPGVIRPSTGGIALEPWLVPVDFPIPLVHYLSNGSYGVLITEAGGGYSRWKGIDITRWVSDTTLDNRGTWIYLTDRETGDLWSMGRQPAGTRSDRCEVRFFPHRAEILRWDNDIFSRMEIIVAPEDDAEIRRIDLTNNSDRTRKLLVCSYAEVVLAPHAADISHPSFNRLFIESEYLSAENALLFRRRPRTAEEKEIFVVHILTGSEGNRSYEVDRERFLGRGGSPANPQFLRDQKAAFSTRRTGTTLDPVMVAAIEIELLPHESASLFFVTAAASDRDAAEYLAKRYKSRSVINEACARAGSFCRREMARMNLTSIELERMQLLLSALIYPGHALRPGSDILRENTLGQQGLWPFGISGDYPLLLVTVYAEDDTTLVYDLLRAHAFWRSRGLMIDFAILNMRESSYEEDIQAHIQGLISRTGGDKWMNRRGGLFLLRADEMQERERILLQTAAGAWLDPRAGSLDKQLERLAERPVRLPEFVPILPSADREETEALKKPEGLLFDNGTGGFSPDGREYVIYLDGDRRTPAPWINVIANPSFGFTTSEAGMECTWAENSGVNRLTPWRNDPVTDMPGEIIYLRDEETGTFWSPTPLPIRENEPYIITHGAGYTTYRHNSHGLEQRLVVCVSLDNPIKVVNLKLVNLWSCNRRITATFYLEPVMGTTRSETRQYIVPEFSATGQALMARNTYNSEFREKVLFLAASREPNGLTTDRTEFLGRRGSYSSPAALGRVGLSGTVGSGQDPCFAMQIMIWIGPGEEKEVTFLLGEGEERENALDLIKQNMIRAQEGALLADVTAFWDNLLGKVHVKTPDTGMNIMLNRWLIYQTLSCRIWGRTALYQSSGAFGFRDQLQDIMALSSAAPGIFRSHILKSASRQFREGDVLHWWHPPSARGIRTRCSDDLLWLPYATAVYIDRTGDLSILSDSVSFLEGPQLEDEESEHYTVYSESRKKASLYDHCLLALKKGSTKGVHGLPLIGSHDWNDGLNRVGVEGKGESVWLGWFLLDTLKRFAPVCELMGDTARAKGCLNQAETLRLALEEHTWDGDWYLRAYYDDGSVLGSKENIECRIDSIAQSWAVLSGAAEPGRAEKAMNSVLEMLVDIEDQLILLFTPPFDKTEKDPGYIKGYLPGIRENGGQYTHAAVWVAWAFARSGRGNTAETLFRLMNPVYHSDTSLKMKKYRVEPYSVAADIYSIPPNRGRGGWTWYTGAAGWLYRLGMEAILGITRKGDRLIIDPCIPECWGEFTATIRYESSVYHIHVENPEEVSSGVISIEMDGECFTEGDIPLTDDQAEHNIRVIMGY